MSRLCDSQLSDLPDQRKLQILLWIPGNFWFFLTHRCSLSLLEVSQPEQRRPVRAANPSLLFSHRLQPLKSLLSSCAQMFSREGTIFLLLKEVPLTRSPFYLFPNAQAENKQTRQILSITFHCSQSIFFNLYKKKKERNNWK